MRAVNYIYMYIWAWYCFPLHWIAAALSWNPRQLYSKLALWCQGKNTQLKQSFFSPIVWHTDALLNCKRQRKYHLACQRRNSESFKENDMETSHLILDYRVRYALGSVSCPFHMSPHKRCCADTQRQNQKPSKNPTLHLGVFASSSLDLQHDEIYAAACELAWTRRTQ